jgi:hypothetical protein
MECRRIILFVDNYPNGRVRRERTSWANSQPLTNG